MSITGTAQIGPNRLGGDRDPNVIARDYYGNQPEQQLRLHEYEEVLQAYGCEVPDTTVGHPRETVQQEVINLVNKGVIPGHIEAWQQKIIEYRARKANAVAQGAPSAPAVSPPPAFVPEPPTLDALRAMNREALVKECVLAGLDFAMTESKASLLEKVARHHGHIKSDVETPPEAAELIAKTLEAGKDGPNPDTP